MSQNPHWQTYDCRYKDQRNRITPQALLWRIPRPPNHIKKPLKSYETQQYQAAGLQQDVKYPKNVRGVDRGIPGNIVVPSSLSLGSALVKIHARMAVSPTAFI